MKKSFSLMALFLGVFISTYGSDGDKGIDCRTNPGPYGGIDCRVDHRGPRGPGPVKVRFRRMPGFGTHGGITLVDICLYPKHMRGKTGGRVLNSVNHHHKKLIEALGEASQCKRSYCAYEAHTMAVKIKDLFIPLHPAINVTIDMAWESGHFKVECKNLSSYG